MNSRSLLSFEEYVFSLEKKRDVELPLQLLEIDEEIEKLRERRAAVLKSIEDVTSDIHNLKIKPPLKSLMDIPHVPWGLIRQCCIGEQNFGILNVCLASPKLDKVIKGISVRNTMRVTGEKVFRVLLENSYLNNKDVRNCLNSNSKDLQRFAGSSWAYENRNNDGILGKEERFQSCKEITDCRNFLA